jgi:DNA helicase II / ATP-dependent DNA helicase PcrA
MFPSGDADTEELRDLALEAKDGCETKDLFKAMMEQITQPDVPATVEEVRVMSLHKSKGLSSPYVFIAACVQGILPPIPQADTPKSASRLRVGRGTQALFRGYNSGEGGP